MGGENNETIGMSKETTSQVPLVGKKQGHTSGGIPRISPKSMSACHVSYSSVQIVATEGRLRVCPATYDMIPGYDTTIIQTV